MLTHESLGTGPQRSSADQFMIKLLRVDTSARATPAEAQSAFQKSIVISSIRCLLTYIFFPFVAPAIGLATSVDKPLGIAISLVAMVSIVISMRRFWRSEHSKRWHYTALGGTVFLFLVVMLGIDVVALVR